MAVTERMQRALASVGENTPQRRAEDKLRLAHTRVGMAASYVRDGLPAAAVSAYINAKQALDAVKPVLDAWLLGTDETSEPYRRDAYRDKS